MLVLRRRPLIKGAQKTTSSTKAEFKGPELLAWLRDWMSHDCHYFHFHQPGGINEHKELHFNTLKYNDSEPSPVRSSESREFFVSTYIKPSPEIPTLRSTYRSSYFCWWRGNSETTLPPQSRTALGCAPSHYPRCLNNILGPLPGKLGLAGCKW